MNKTIAPFCVSGSISAPASKSDAIRALLCAALYCGETLTENLPVCGDITAAVSCLRSLGADIRDAGNGALMVGRRLTGGGKPFCSESASALRFLLPVAAALGKETFFDGDESLKKRPISGFMEELSRHGAVFDGDGLPFTVRGKLTGGSFEVPGDVSSQYVSGLMFALPLTGEKSEIAVRGELQSAKYAEMTANILKKAGVIWEKTKNGFALVGNEPQRTEKYTVEGDWSGAAYFASMAALRGEIKISGLSLESSQPDAEIVRLLRDFGAEVSFERGTLCVKEKEKRPICADVAQFPDLFPTLCVLACGAKGKSRFYNGKRLRLKESDRIESVKKLITSLGGEVEAAEDGLTVIGKGFLSGGTADCGSDHRTVMSAAMAGAVSERPVTVMRAECVNKSFPDFFEKLGKVTVTGI